MTTLDDALKQLRADRPTHGRWRWVLGRNVYAVLVTARDAHGQYLLHALSQTVMGLPFRIVEQRDVLRLEELP